MIERGHEAAGARLIGRDRELARIDAFVDAATSGTCGLVIRGEAGIGKTALWRAALDRVRARGHRTLVARPAEEESRGSLIGLADLFEALDPEPALLAPDTDLFDRGRAVLRTLRQLTAEQPVVLAIDDGQWFDNASARALRYALRRLEDRPVWLVATHRTGEPDEQPLLPRERTEDVSLGPLPIEAIRQAIKPLVATIPRPTLESIHRLSGGNPMYAIELARAPAATATGFSLRATLSTRLAAAPPSIRAIVQAAAALGPASPELLQRAGDEPVPPVADAIDRGLLTLDDSMLVRCAHPLLGSVALGDIEPSARRSLHARLVGVVGDPEERARHLALSATDRDAPMAAELEAAARRAGQRGAPSAAAELAAHSVRLTPLDDGRALARRAVAEILHRAAAGETARAVAMLDAIISGLPPGRERIAALTLRVGLDFGRADEVLAQAHDDATADELVRGRILDLLAYMTYMYRGDLDRARRLAAEAAIADRHGDTELEMLASVTVATTALLAGDPQPDLMERALELGRHVRGPRLGRWPDVEQARHDLWAGRLHEARALFERLHAMTTASGIEFQRPYRLSDLAAVEVAAGRLSVAAELADDGLESALDAGNLPVAMWLRYPDGLASAHRGDMARAARAAAEMRTWGLEHDELPRLLMAHHVDGVVALARGDTAAALAALLAGVALGRRAGHAHPGVVAVLPDAIEAAAVSGAVELAADLADDLDTQAAALDLPWVDAAARRGRGLAAIAVGDKTAQVSLAEAATAFEHLGYRLDAARACWWHGRALQRTGRRVAAADALADAGERFRSMGADPWAALARADLERVAPGRTTGSLTETEARIAELVAAGGRNREVAAALFVSVATVEAHLTRIYRKLGVRSRTELSRRVPKHGHRNASRRVPSPRGDALDGRARARRPRARGRPAGRPDALASDVLRGDPWRRRDRQDGALALGHRRAPGGRPPGARHPPGRGGAARPDDRAARSARGHRPGTWHPRPGDRSVRPGRAVLRTLRRLAVEGPVVVAIDDVHWLDAITARSLRYAARRLDTEPVVILITARTATPTPGDVVPPDRAEELIVGPLAADAIAQVVRRAVGTAPRPVLERIAKLSGGNPMYAIELARSSSALTDRFGAVTPPPLRGVLATRLGDVPDDLLAVLRTAAALGPAPATLLDRACAPPGAAGLIHDAVDEGLLVEGDDGTIWFDHPLLASVVLDGMNPLERKALHGHLAAIVTDLDAEARHLALSCSERDDTIAAALEAAAERAGRRGAAFVAADLADHSVRVTPLADADAATRRTVAAISYRAAAGEPERALAMADEVLGRLDAGPGRLEAITLRVFLDIDHGEEILADARRDAGEDPWWRGRLLELLGWLLGTYRGQLERGVELGGQALAIAVRERDPELEMLAAATSSTAALLAGRPEPDLMDRALALAEAHEPPRLGRWPQLFRARHCLWSGELDEARRRFEAARVAFSVRGVEFQRPYRLNDLAWVEVLAGNLHTTIELTDDALEAALDAGNAQAAAWHSYPAGLARAHLGHHDIARDAAASLRAWALEHDQPPRLLMAHHVLGLVALAGGDAARATNELEPALALAARLGYRHPGYVPVLPDAIEAAALAGDAAGCRVLVAELDAQAAALRAPWVDAAAQRGHGLAELVTGAGTAADTLARAAATFEALGHRLDAARTELLRGRALRRAGRRTDAAAVLADARHRFADMGASPWADQATVEIERVVPNRRVGDLTVTESRIAELVGRGRRNREIAGELVISVATVEAHLTRMYRRLGVRSRTELTRLLDHRP